MGMVIWGVVIGWWLACVAAGVRLAGRQQAAGPSASGGRRAPRLALRGYPLVVVAVVVGLPVLLIAATPEPLVETTAVVVLVVVIGAALLSVSMNLGGYDPDAAGIAARLSADAASQQLLVRWLTRVRWRRWLGGALGVTAGVLGGGPLPTTLTIGLAGLLTGSLSAEVHHLRRAGGGAPRQADLRQRRMGDYTFRGEQGVLAAVAVVATLALAAALIGGEWAAARWATAALVTLGLVVVFQWRIATRRRPALPAELGRADDLLRRLAASRGVAQPGLALGSALVGQAASTLGVRPLALLAWVVAFAYFWDGRRLGLDHLLARPPVAA